MRSNALQRQPLSTPTPQSSLRARLTDVLLPSAENSVVRNIKSAWFRIKSRILSVMFMGVPDVRCMSAIVTSCVNHFTLTFDQKTSQDSSEGCTLCNFPVSLAFKSLRINQLTTADHGHSKALTLSEICIHISDKVVINRFAENIKKSQNVGTYQ